MEPPTFLCTVSEALRALENLGWDTPCYRARGLQTKAGISGELLGQCPQQSGAGGLPHCSVCLPADGLPLLPSHGPNSTGRLCCLPEMCILFLFPQGKTSSLLGLNSAYFFTVSFKFHLVNSTHSSLPQASKKAHVAHFLMCV